MTTLTSPPVGWPVQFFIAGDPKADPVAAIVTQSSPSGQVKLNLFHQGGGEMRHTPGYIRHISDPWVKEHPDLMRQALGGATRGAWDWVPGLVCRPITPPHEITKEQSQPAVDRKAEGKAKVRELLDAGKDDVDEIMKTVRFYGLTRADVQAHVDELVSA